jgi:hybrid cluster-associated redox disulfide protein
MPTINEKTRIKELLKKPEAKKVLAKHGMICAKCKGSENENLKNAAQNHGLALEEFIREIKTAIKSGK